MCMINIHAVTHFKAVIAGNTIITSLGREYTHKTVSVFIRNIQGEAVHDSLSLTAIQARIKSAFTIADVTFLEELPPDVSVTIF